MSETSTLTVEAGGVMTNDVGVITGELEVTTDVLQEGTVVTATYAGSTDVYTVTGSPVTSSPDHATVVAELSRDRGVGPDGNVLFRDLSALDGASDPVDPGDEGTL